MEKTGITDQITDEQLAEIREAFNSFDRLNKGCISVREFGNVLHQLGINPNPKELREMIAEIDEDESGEIDLNEFIKFMVDRLSSEEMKNEQELFYDSLKVFDIFNDGTIPNSEIRFMVEEKFKNLSPKEIEELMNNLDFDCQGTIDFKTLSHYMTKE